MALNPYNPINSIDSTTYDWSCRVRVQSFWKGLNRESQEFWGLNMLLIDDSVKNIQDLIKTKKNDEDKTIFKFELSNGSSSLNVTLFDYFGEQLENEFAKLESQNLYVIICCARVGRYEGVPHLSNYPATRVFINPKHYSIDALKRSMSEKKPESAIVDVPTANGEVDLPRKIMTVKEIIGMKAEFGQANVFCEVTVKRIIDKSAWYFRKCTGCDLELEHVNGKFKCSRTNGCGRIIPYPDKRFRLCTLCSDDTGSIAIIFPDQAITTNLDKTVIDLHAECADETEEDKFPEILNSLLKRKYTVNLAISEDNIKKGSTVYQALDVLQAQENGDSFDPNKTPLPQCQDVSMVTVSETDVTAHLTPNTGDSSTIKSRARKINEALDFNPTDPSPIQPLKSVKVENYHTLDKLKNGVDDYKIKVRVIRLWRGATRTGEEFKSFNLILLDHKGQRIHAFVPTKAAAELQHQIIIGRVFSFKNFTVQSYTQSDKFRVLRNESQLVFSKDTVLQELADDGVTIPQDAFDFYDHSQLLELSNQTTYLADVVGIIKKYENIFELTNRHGIKQKQAKFSITDGSSNLNVTFWDKFGESFDKQMKTATEKPVIIIISAGRVGKFNGKNVQGEVDISNNNATKVLLNYKHHSVSQLRKMLSNPDFASRALGEKKKRKMQHITIENIKKLGKEAVEGFYMAHVKLLRIDQLRPWFYYACTSCDKEPTMLKPCPVCESCNRYVPYPETKFRLHVEVGDTSGTLQVILPDREVRTMIGKRASDLVNEFTDVKTLPPSLAAIIDKDYSLVVQISEVNIHNGFQIYWATNICKGFVNISPEAGDVVSITAAQTSQATTSTGGDQGISEVNLKSL
ncbi:hypothetical protein DCAR_0520484 [Daucus carota subsp. sativus]|uniref:Uncharacterized protein n=1 Tax=Daucus carota subsp. sativus TaxID=79200 RepID=A0A164YK78_DAUCS|nr:hypothetical protein DCAR_0520484 [Daucus carota subsp. sativus]